jgi:hypothetical protein
MNGALLWLRQAFAPGKSRGLPDRKHGKKRSDCSMTFQAYIDNIKAKTGKTPAEFKKLAKKEGLLEPGVKAGAIVAWLKRDFGLGHGHAMAIYATFKGRTK